MREDTFSRVTVFAELEKRPGLISFGRFRALQVRHQGVPHSLGSGRSAVLCCKPRHDPSQSAGLAPKAAMETQQSWQLSAVVIPP
jgi:hypothetical protein